MGQTRNAWETRIRARMGDLGVLQRVPAERIPLALETALATLSADRPKETTVSLVGDGSAYSLTLTGWIDRWSRVLRVEYPTGERIPSYLEEGRDFTVLPGTSTFRLYNLTPASGETCAVTFATRWPTPTDSAAVDLVPSAWFEAVCSLAAAEAVKAQAVEYARKQSVGVAGDLFNLDPGPLFTAAASLRRLYDEIVLGLPPEGRAGETRSELAMGVVDQETFPRALFHRRSSVTP